MDADSGPHLTPIKILGWALSLVALGFVGRWLWQLDRSIWEQLTELNVWFLLLSLGFFLAWFVLRFLAWQSISRKHGYQSPTTQHVQAWALSEFMRYVPGNVWSFAARWKSSVTAGSSKTAATQAIVVEALSLVGGAVVVAGLLAQPDWWWIGAIGLGAYLLITPPLFSMLWKRFRADVVAIHTGELLKLMLVYAASWILFGLATASVYYSFPTPPPILIVQLVGFSVLAWLLGYLSLITPMGLGVREAALVWLLTPISGASFAALITVVSRLWLIVSELVFVGLTLINRRKT